MRRALAVAAGMAASFTVTLAAPAGAATTLGSAATATASSCGTSGIVWETDGPFVVPAGGGIITSMATHSPSAVGTMSFKVVSGSTVIGSSPSFTVAAGENRQAVHIPVSGGEFLGFWFTTGTQCAVNTTSGNVTGGSSASDPPVGTAVPTSGSTTATLSVEATLEPDADHDGFADESEDSCPNDPSLHAGPCQVDVGVVQSVVPSTIGVGDVAVATATFTNGSAGIAAVTLGATVSDGLQIVGSFPAAGCAFTPALSCPLGSLAGGASTVGALVVKGVKTGTQSVTVGSSSANDPNPANNTAKSTVIVEARQAVKCRVPKLKGLTKAFAKTLLKAVNCKLGKATGKGKISKQAKKPGSVLPAGTKVNVTLRK